MWIMHDTTGAFVSVQEEQRDPPSVHGAAASPFVAPGQWLSALADGRHWCTPETERLLVPALLGALTRSAHFPKSQSLFWIDAAGPRETVHPIHVGTATHSWYLGTSSSDSWVRVYSGGVIDSPPGWLLGEQLQRGLKPPPMRIDCRASGHRMPEGLFLVLNWLLGPQLAPHSPPDSPLAGAEAIRHLVLEELAQQPDLLQGMAGVRLLPMGSRRAPWVALEPHAMESNAPRLLMADVTASLAPAMPHLVGTVYGDRDNTARALEISESCTCRHFDTQGYPTPYALRRWEQREASLQGRQRTASRPPATQRQL